jgi:uncharacterized membrane protein
VITGRRLKRLGGVSTTGAAGGWGGGIVVLDWRRNVFLRGGVPGRLNWIVFGRNSEQTKTVMVGELTMHRVRLGLQEQLVQGRQETTQGELLG